MTESLFVLIGGVALALVTLALIVGVAEWLRDLRQRRERHARARKDPFAFQDFHRDERQRQIQRLSEEAKRLDAATKIGTRH